jgi:hypothetical protein
MGMRYIKRGSMYTQEYILYYYYYLLYYIYILIKVGVGGEFTLIPPLLLTCGTSNLVKLQIN